MTSEELAEIEARANAATPGPWETHVTYCVITLRYGDDGYLVADCGASESPDCCEGNAPFIAHARTDVPALVAEVRRLAALVAGAPGEELEQRAWVRGFFNALAYHSEGVDREEGIASTGLLTEEEAIAAGAEPGDVEKMRPEFAMLQSIAADRERRRAAGGWSR